MLVKNDPGSKMQTLIPQGSISRLRASENASTPYLLTEYEPKKLQEISPVGMQFKKINKA